MSAPIRLVLSSHPSPRTIGADGLNPAASNLPDREFTVDPDLLRTLVHQARDAATRAYAPFSHFRVGAALVMADDPAGLIITGTNVENSSYGLGICAERNAIHQAVSRGWRQLRYLAVSCTDAAGLPLSERSPCGACRQVIREFADAGTLILLDRGTADSGVDFTDVEGLLPFGFRLGKA